MRDANGPFMNVLFMNGPFLCNILLSFSFFETVFVTAKKKLSEIVNRLMAWPRISSFSYTRDFSYNIPLDGLLFLSDG